MSLCCSYQLVKSPSCSICLVAFKTKVFSLLVERKTLWKLGKVGHMLWALISLSFDSQTSHVTSTGRFHMWTQQHMDVLQSVTAAGLGHHCTKQPLLLFCTRTSFSARQGLVWFPSPDPREDGYWCPLTWRPPQFSTRIIKYCIPSKGNAFDKVVTILSAYMLSL